MNNAKIDQAYLDAVAVIEKNLGEFREKLDAGTSDPDNFITLSEMEREWALLNKTTSKTYSDILSAYLSEMDERAIIKVKKENTNERGSI